MHPANGYLLSQLHFKSRDLVEINQIITQINGVLIRLGVGSLPVQDLNEVLNISVENLRQIPSLRNLMIDLSLVNPKVELSTEYKQLQELVEVKSPALINRMDQIVQKIDLIGKKKFNRAVEEFDRKAVNLSYSLDKVQKSKHQTKLDQYIVYSDFKPLINDLISEENSVKHFLLLEDNSEELDKIFLSFKRIVMANKAKLPDLMAQFGSEIPINEVRDLDPIAFEYLRSLAFQEVARNYFNLEVRDDKTLEQRVVRPTDSLASLLKVSPVQMAIFALSLDPIRSFGLSKGQKMESSQNPDLKFVVLNDQEQRVINQKVKVPLSNDQSVYILTPVYVSYVKAELAKNLQSSSIRYA